MNGCLIDYLINKNMKYRIVSELGDSYIFLQDEDLSIFFTTKGNYAIFSGDKFISTLKKCQLICILDFIKRGDEIGK